MDCNIHQNYKICFSSSVIKNRIISLASIHSTLVTDQNSNLNDQFTINKIEVKQIKPTIIYNETQWTPIVALNYKTQITNTQWTVSSINPQASNSETIQKKSKQNYREHERIIFLHLHVYTVSAVQLEGSTFCASKIRPYMQGNFCS